mmetsp:Transcript_12062/g.23039  ORF Transcript_12062/g.23039 Transcript_12062/m.23039 type:complete len:506 (+) Transcript_12062:3-1520(+)
MEQKTPGTPSVPGTEGEWRIRIKRTRNKEFWVNVSPKATVKDLMERIRSTSDVPVDTQRIIWKGHVMRDGSLEDFGMWDGCAVHLLTCREPAAPPIGASPSCHNGHPMVVSDYSGGGYANGWLCDRCGRTGLGNRWLCLICRCDYCLRCDNRPNIQRPPRLPRRVAPAPPNSSSRSAAALPGTQAPAREQPRHSLRITTQRANGTSMNVVLQGAEAKHHSQEVLRSLQQIYNQLDQHGDSKQPAEMKVLQQLVQRNLPPGARRSGPPRGRARGGRPPENRKQTIEQLSQFLARTLHIDRKSNPVSGDSKGVVKISREMCRVLSAVAGRLDQVAGHLQQHDRQQRLQDAKSNGNRNNQVPPPPECKHLGVYLQHLGPHLQRLGVLLTKGVSVVPLRRAPDPSHPRLQPPPTAPSSSPRASSSSSGLIGSISSTVHGVLASIPTPTSIYTWLTSSAPPYWPGSPTDTRIPSQHEMARSLDATGIAGVLYAYQQHPALLKQTNEHKTP